MGPPSSQQRPLVLRRQRQSSSQSPVRLASCVLYGLVAIVIVYVVFIVQSFGLPGSSSSGHDNDKEGTHPGIRQPAPRPHPQLSSTDIQQCFFREYPPRRYYGLSKPPDFLVDDKVEYIYGEYPLLLSDHAERLNPQSQGKLCVDQSEWLSPPLKDRLPFADGTNPSIVSIPGRLSHHPLYAQFQSMGAAFVATICMTNSQCAWNDTPMERDRYRLSLDDKPTTVRTVLVLLDSNFRTLHQTTLLLERDAQWGKRVRPKQQPDGSYALDPYAFDDARLFLHQGQLWVSYREGPGFGWDRQVLNPVHLQLEPHFTGILKASETTSFCCGRNMALMEPPPGSSTTPTLQSLTWVDPVTVIQVSQEENNRRRLSKKKKSDFHGTNAFMVYLPQTQEYLGMGHFHRPPGRDKNEFARFGHHYTHALFAISALPPYRLTRLSPEFVFPSKYHAADADIIQFASGLELYDESPDDTSRDPLVVVAYGINDCEAAAFYLELETVNSLLRPVDEGVEVVDLMQPLKKH